MGVLGLKVKERLLLFIKHTELSNRAFEKKCGLSNGYIQNFKGNLGQDKLSGILTSFPELSESWLLYGEGDMLVTQDQPEVPAEPKPAVQNPLVEYLQRKIAELEKEKDALLQENAVLRHENRKLAFDKGESADGVIGSLSVGAVR